MQRIFSRGVFGVLALGAALASACATGGEDGAGDERVAGARQWLKPTGAFLVLNSPFNTIDLGFLPVNQAGPVGSATLRNDGSAALTISALALSGAQAAEFAFGPGSTCSGATLTPGASCIVELSATPGALGRRNARLVVTSTATGSPHRIPVLATGFDPTGAGPTAGPVDPRYGFPAWYQDGAGLRLEPCVENATLCPDPLPNLSLPPLVADTGSNFPDESFYWTAEVDLRPTGNIRARLILALEAAFAGAGDVAVGEQIVFSRTRLRLEGVSANTAYTFTHPFGSRVVVSDNNGKIDLTEDIGCGASPCDFRQALASPIVGGFLKWDPAFTPAAPAGFVGNPNVNHRIVGSPTGNNFYRVDGPNVGGAGVSTIQTNLFSVAGKLLP